MIRNRRMVGELLRHLASRVRPAVRERPSEWAERNVVLTREQSADRPGPWRNDYLPFTRDLHDLEYDNPTKIGEICIKPSQVGFSRVKLNRHAQKALEDPKPRLYVTDIEERTKRFADREFRPMLEKMKLLSAAVGKAMAAGDRKTMTTVPFPGGRMQFAFAGGEVIGEAFAEVDVDEYEAAMEQLPPGRGDLWVSSEGRVESFGSAGRVSAQGHPRWYKQGLHALYEDRSDMRCWVFDCPHCDQPVFPTWDLVRYTRLKDEISGDPDPASAQLHCPHCDHHITDEERAESLWPMDMRQRGTGRFRSTLTPEEAAARTHVGVWVTRLCDPRVTVARLAAGWLKCKSTKEKMDYMNKVIGEPYREVTAIMSVATIDDCIERTAGMPLPGGPLGIQLVTVGVDVQSPPGQSSDEAMRQLIFYIGVVGWAVSGMAYVLQLRRILCPIDELATSYLPKLRANLDDGRVLAPAACGIDAAWKTSKVLEFCRTMVWSQVAPSPIRLVALRYDKSVRIDAPVREANENRRRHPTRTDANSLDYLDLSRESWVDRHMARWSDKRIRVMCEEPADLKLHLTSNVKVPVKKVHGMGEDRDQWELMKARRDDWFQCLAYAEAAAAIRCNLDRLAEDAERSAGNVGLTAPSFDLGGGFIA